MKRVARRAATIHWPAFQVAAVLENAVFAFVEPQALRTLGGGALPLSESTVH